MSLLRLRTAVFVLVAALLVPGCALLRQLTRPPKVTLERVRIQRITFEQVTLSAELRIRNRYPVQVPVPRIGYGLDVDGKPLIDGKLDHSFTLPSANSSNPTKKVKVPVAFSFMKLYALSTTYKNREDAAYKLRGEVDIDTPVGPVTVPFEHKGRFPILRPPQVDMPEVVVRNLNLQGADLRLKFRIRNPNNVNLSVQKMRYGLDVAGMRVANGTLPRSVEMSAHGNTTADMDIHVGLQQVGAALQTIFSRNTLAYRLDGSLTVGTPWGDLSTPLKANGTANLRR